jgi:hypothetical protein
MAITPKIRGGYPKGPINQGSGRGAFEDPILSRAPQSPLGNADQFRLATSGANAGPGADRQVSKSGQNDMHGPANPGVSVSMGPHPIDRIYGKRGG